MGKYAAASFVLFYWAKRTFLVSDSSRWPAPALSHVTANMSVS